MKTEGRQPIEDPEYWRGRLKEATKRDRLYQSIYLCDPHKWNQIGIRHKEILQRTILPNESVLDAGCGYGRLLSLMPKGWGGEYLGIDLSPDFIKIAAKDHNDRSFICGPLEIVLPNLQSGISQFILPVEGETPKFDWCVLVSIREMITRECGQQAWDNIAEMISKVAHRVLVLEYSPTDEGSVEYT